MRSRPRLKKKAKLRRTKLQSIKIFMVKTPFIFLLSTGPILYLLIRRIM